MRELPDTSSLSMTREKVNWEMIHGKFILLTPDDFGRGSSDKMSKLLGVSRSSLDRHRKISNPSTGKTWDEERKEVHKEVSEQVLGSVVQSVAAERIDLITKAKKRKSLIDTNIDAFLNSDKFDVTDDNLKHLLEISEKIAQGIGKLAGITDSGGGKSINFTLNVPPKYLTMEGRRWVEKQIENPSDLIDTPFEEIKTEEQMQKKLTEEKK